MNDNPRFDKSLLENRQICIFLSSTFSDMQEERSSLVKTFLKLKVKAARRNVTLALLDLRWGVTDEEAQDGKVLSVCLNEIEHSHPFFIGLLGNRYGYEFDVSELSKNPDLLERYPWLEDDIVFGRSITEIEMLYGALRNLEYPADAAFFIKQTSEPDDNPKQTSLKKMIQGQKLYPVDVYSDTKVLCSLVELLVSSMLDRYFPDGKHTPLERERTAQCAYINSHHSFFVGREKELDYIDTFVHSNRNYLVITGESGMGKSALMAYWIKSNETNDAFHLIYHFVGNSFTDNDYVSVLHHLCEEIYDLYKIEKDPNKHENPEDEAQRLVSEIINQDMPLVVIIDGLDQITAPKNEKLLLWLPNANRKVKFIFTTNHDDPTMQAFECRGYETYTLKALNDTQREHFIIEYLEQVGKHLEKHLLQRIVDDPENLNTLVLRTLLDELICFGSHEHLVTRVDYYLSANSILDFFDKVLQRMEIDYNNGQELVNHTLRLIALSEHGLSEEELLAITGFRQMDWHLFYCAFFNHLVVKGGLITFSHQHVAVAVSNRYETRDAHTSAFYRHEIVKHFADMTPEDMIQRQRCISEMAYQYYNLADWPNLYHILLSFESFDFYNNNNKKLLANYWRALLATDNTQYKLSDYLQIPQPEKESFLTNSYNDIGLFVFCYFSELNIALEYFFKALAIREKDLGTEHPDTATTYNNIGGVYDEQGEYNKALEYYFKTLAILKKSLGEEHPNTASCYDNIGVAYAKQSIYTKALKYCFKALTEKEKVFGLAHPDTATSYNNIGMVYKMQGDYNTALEYYSKALAILKKTLGEEHPNTASCYDNIGSVYETIHDYNTALEYCLKALLIKEKVLGMEHHSTAISYNNIGMVYKKQCNYAKALEYYLKALAIMEKGLSTEHPNTASAYNNIAILYNQLGENDKSLRYHRKAILIKEKCFGTEHPSTAISYNNIGMVYYSNGDYSKALDYFNKAYLILAATLGSQQHNTIVALNWINKTKTKIEQSPRSNKGFFRRLFGE